MGMIDFKVRNEDDDGGGGGGMALRRSCLPNPFGKPLRGGGPSSPRGATTTKGQGSTGQYQQQDDEEGDATIFDKELVSVLSPPPSRGYQQLQQNHHQRAPSSRGTTTTMSMSPMSWSAASPPPPSSPSPVDWQIVSGSDQSHHQQVAPTLSRSEFSAVVSLGSFKDVEHLLTPPAPSDRSARRRVEYEQDLRRRRKQLSRSSDGEMEPPGKWGESMTTVPLQPRMRSFRPLSPRRRAALSSSLSSPQETQQILSVSGASRSAGQHHAFTRSIRASPSYLDRKGSENPTSENQAVGVSPGSVVMTARSGAPQGTYKALGKHFEHPTFSVPFPLATTPPPPPPPPRPLQPRLAAERRSSNHLSPTPSQAALGKSTSAPRSGTSRKAKLVIQDPTRAGRDQDSPDPAEAATEDRGDDLRCYISSSGSSDSDASNASSFDVAVLDSETKTTPSVSSIMEDVEVLNKLAMEHIERGEFENALSVFNHVLKVQQERYGEVHPANAGTYHNMGTVHAKRASAIGTTAGESEQRHCRAQAVTCFQAAARIARDSLGPTHPNVAVSLVRIGLILLESRQYQNALITFREALRLRLCFYGKNHRLVANVYNNMGLCSAQLGDFEEAKGYLDAAISIQRQLAESGGANQDLLELGDTLFNLGGLNMEWIRQEGSNTRRILEAEACFTEVLKIRTKILGSNSGAVLQVKTLLDIARSLPGDVADSTSTSIDVSGGRAHGRELGKDSRVRAFSEPSRNMSSLRLGPALSYNGRLNHHERPHPVSHQSENKERIQDSRESLKTSERKEHLYSLLVSLVEQDPRRRDISS